MSAVLASLPHWDELFALALFKLSQTSAHVGVSTSNDRISRTQCYYFLKKTSRSFAMVIQELDSRLRDAVCIFYLVLRGLDTIEDDMTIPRDKKIDLLSRFHTFLYQRGWRFTENGKDEKDRILMEEFHVVVDEFLNLPKSYQIIIVDIQVRMAKGMIEFLNRSVVTVNDYNLYCHYVAGLVGIGLSQIFEASGMETLGELTKSERLSNSMGLFLQKTNIIRDFLEDFQDSRIFWPKEIWSKYTNDLQNFTSKDHKSQALACLNHMVTDALQHIPDVLAYMSKIQDPTIFKFCAIPQVMAIATLSLVFNNPDVFTREVKIRKGLAVKLMFACTSYEAVASVFKEFCNQMTTKISYLDPNQEKTSLALGQALQICDQVLVNKFPHNTELGGGMMETLLSLVATILVALIAVNMVKLI